MQNPLWEGSCQIKYQTMDEFFQFCNNEEAVKKEWRYLDYKHMTELLKDKISFFKANLWSLLLIVVCIYSAVLIV